MLYSIEDTKNPITHIPHEKDYKRWRRNLGEDEYHNIMKVIDSMIDGNEVRTSSWMPGSDWSGTAFEAIYTKACEYDDVASGLCFGLFVWVAMQERPEAWSFGRYEKDGIPIKGLTYFQIQLPR